MHSSRSRRRAAGCPCPSIGIRMRGSDSATGTRAAHDTCAAADSREHAPSAVSRAVEPTTAPPPTAFTTVAGCWAQQRSVRAKQHAISRPGCHCSDGDCSSRCCRFRPLLDNTRACVTRPQPLLQRNALSPHSPKHVFTSAELDSNAASLNPPDAPARGHPSAQCAVPGTDGSVCPSPTFRASCGRSVISIFTQRARPTACCTTAGPHQAGFAAATFDATSASTVCDAAAGFPATEPTPSSLHVGTG